MDDSLVLLLIKVITALYLNDKANDDDKHIYDELKTIVAEIKPNKRAGDGLGSEDSIISSLRDTAEWMIFNKDGGYNKTDIIQRLSINIQGNHEYLEIAKDSIDDTMTGDEARQRVFGIMKELKYSKKKNTLKNTIQKANSKINFSGDYVEVGPFVNELVTELTNIHSGDANDINGLVNKVDFTNPNEVQKALEDSISKIKPEGCLKTGLVGLDKAAGGFGIARGELVDFGALTHNYKSSILLDLSINIPTLNDPWLWDPTKKPMILRISFENTVDLDIKTLYQNAIERQTGEKCDIENVVLSEASVFMTELLQSRGYTFQLEHYDPSNFIIYDLFKILNNYISQGYEIHAVIIDYLPLIADNTFGDRLDVKIQKTYEMTRNFCNGKGIAVITAAQLSTQAQEESRANPYGLAKKCSTGGWYMDCKSLHTKLDLEFIMHIIQHADGKSYLNIARGKHRNHQTTPMRHRNFYYLFNEIGGIGGQDYDNPRVLYELPRVVGTDNSDISWE